MVAPAVAKRPCFVNVRRFMVVVSRVDTEVYGFPRFNSEAVRSKTFFIPTDFLIDYLMCFARFYWV